MRALEPVRVGDVERDGVRLHWEEFGAGEPTIALLPTWSIVHSRHWKFQVPYLARHHRVITFDGRGCGLSDRPVGAAAYTHLEFAADTIAVLDATDTEQAVLVAFSCGVLWAVQVAADHPDRVRGLVAICPAVPLTPMHAERTVHPFDEPIESHRGLGQVQPSSLAPRLRGLPDLLRRQVVPRSTLDQGDRGLRRVGAGDRSGDTRRRPPRPRRMRPGEHPVGVRARASTGARHPRRRGCDPAIRRWGRPC